MSLTSACNSKTFQSLLLHNSDHYIYMKGRGQLSRGDSIIHRKKHTNCPNFLKRSSLKNTANALKILDLLTLNLPKKKNFLFR